MKLITSVLISHLYFSAGQLTVLPKGMYYVRDVLVERAKLNGKSIVIKGVLHAGDEGAYLKGTSCKEEINAFGRPWVCGLQIDVANTITPDNSRAIYRKLRELLMEARKGKSDGVEVLIRAKIMAAPRIKTKGGDHIEVGLGHLAAFAAVAFVEGYVDCGVKDDCRLKE